VNLGEVVELEAIAARCQGGQGVDERDVRLRERMRKRVRTSLLKLRSIASFVVYMSCWSCVDRLSDAQWIHAVYTLINQWAHNQ
jgi:hypothetical protein